MGLLFRFASQWVAGETMAEGLARAEEAVRAIAKLEIRVRMRRS